MERHLRAINKYSKDLFIKANVIGIGVGYKQIRGEETDQLSLIIFVEKKVPPDRLNKSSIIPGKISDLHTDIVEIGRVRLLDNRVDRWRPACPGISIGHYKISAGTFGAVVKDKNTGEKLILSNNHILANATNGSDGRSSIGDPILQPGPHDGGGPKDKIATLLRFIPIRHTVQDVECPIAAAALQAGNIIIHTVRPRYNIRLTKYTNDMNNIDAAVAKPDKQSLVDEEVLEIGRIEGVARVIPGDSVKKSGRTSGLSEGKVQAIGVTIKVGISEEENGLFTDQVVSNILSQPGDSGSLIVNSGKQAVGLLFAGSEKYSIFNRIDNVMERLKIKF
ncbi:MAG TPA: hypothetical protein DCK76_04105 [Desulfotomaculum sp.]|nr:MAG: hypothetical protein XD84_0642 [Desulfotomaculum sp. 46_80]KUK85313.1 MAG: hypothetical protein XE00_0025 [Desulfofundulus kuznetsovii]HAG10569.1 hypothetical protein [Desulfotomaculum sp.]HBY03460.1 hypothetical protein [Desulfotomaculum sp.]